MKLLLDLGNTRLKWAVWDGVLGPVRAEPHRDRPLDVFLAQAWPAVEAVWLSAVPRLADPAGWNAAVLAHCGLLPQFAHSIAEWRGLRSAYAEPQRLGIDRWLAMLALWQQLRAPFVVVSAGTALTVDRVAADGRHLGGIIAPGYGSTLASLLKVTATPGRPTVVGAADQLGTSSETAIRQGALFAAVGAVERCLSLPGTDPTERRILTGGDAAALQAQLPGHWERRPELVLEGLLALATAPA
ncbi:MAG: type III pantothenate kinase [Stagnimonas sp.]|nr:type III pantothenate kinase [Stagnimonas sp.]